MPADNLIILEEVRSRYDRCPHTRMEIDEELAYVKCRDCGEELNPIRVLQRLAKEESRFEWRRQELKKTIEQLDAKKRTKCQHCGRMTSIRTK